MVGILGCCALSASADPYDFRDFDRLGWELNTTSTTSKNEWFDIVTAGTNPSTDPLDVGGYVLGTDILSALALFSLESPNGATKTVEINLSGVFDSGSVSSKTPVIFDGDGSINGSSTVELGIIAALETNGKISYTVTRTDTTGAGNLRVNYADLQVWLAPFTPPNNDLPSVPDGGSTLAFLGLGLAGVLGFGRKLRTA